MIDLHLQISNDLERRRHSLQDVDGHIQRITRSLQDRTRVWTEFPAGDTLKPGELETYIINCPSMHPLTSLTISRLLGDEDQSNGIKVLRSAGLVEVRGVFCPRCKNRETASFTQARLVEPLRELDQELMTALHFSQKKKKALHIIKRRSSIPKRNSAAIEPSPTTPSWPSPLAFITRRSGSTQHSRTGSGENTSHTSSVDRHSISTSGSPTPNQRVSYAMFADARYVLANTSHKIYCYDCELRSWSKGSSFNRIIMTGGSSARYAVISRETSVNPSQSNEMKEDFSNIIV